MKRRDFLKNTGVVSFGVVLNGYTGSLRKAESSEKTRFLKERSRNDMLFPCPPDGIELPITPVGLAWLPCLDAENYQVEIFDENGRQIYQKNVGKDPVHLPDKVLKPGKYFWDVIALDRNGKVLDRRGRKSFIILRDAEELPWIDTDELLSRVPKSHPRLLYPRESLQEIRRTLLSSRKRNWKNCLAAAENALNMPAPQYPSYHLIRDRRKSRLEYTRYFQYFRQLIDGALMDLALAYLMTEDEKYARAAKRILLEVTKWHTADDDVTSVMSKWGDEPGLSLAKCAHRAYDWLYEALTAEERQKVLKMCEARAWQCYRRLTRKNFLTYPGGSHNGRLIAYLTDMALVMAGESSGALTWLEYSLKALTTIYPHWAGIDGGWAEGTAYGLLYNIYYIPSFEGLRQLTGFNLWKRPFFKNVRYFFFYCTAIRGEMQPFGDKALKGGPGVHGGSGFPDLMWFHAHRYNDPYTGWWVKQIKGWNGSKGELALLFPDEPPVKKPENIPQSRVFRSVGWAGLHSDITDPDNDTCMIFKSSPYGSVSHSHADQNSFAIMKGGVALAIPSGHFGPTYGSPHHATWTRSTKANNCILVNGEGQVIREAKASGRITDFVDRRGFTYVAGDAAPAYMGKLRKFNRHILFLRPAVFLLLDELAAPRPAQFQWMFHALEKMIIKENQIISSRKGAKLQIFLKCPEGLHFSQTDKFDTPYNEGIPKEYQEQVPNHWHVTAETTKKTRETRIGAILVVTGPDENVNVQMLEQKGWFGIRASGNFGKVEGWLQIQPGYEGPVGFQAEVAQGKIKLCGRAKDGEIFSI